MLRLLQQAVFFKAAEAVLGNDDVVEDFDAQELAGFDQPFVHGQVFFGRLEVAGRMVMSQDNLDGKMFNRRFEDFPGVD